MIALLTGAFTNWKIVKNLNPPTVKLIGSLLWASVFFLIKIIIMLFGYGCQAFMLLAPLVLINDAAA